MKRHDALSPLSREHHGALILARLMQKNAPAYKGLPSDAAGKAEYALQQFKSMLSVHFEKEEIMLNDLIKFHPEIEKLTEEIVAEHHHLVKGFNSLKNAADLKGALDILGVALENHIRKEERILFPLIQEHCPDEILRAIRL